MQSEIKTFWSWFVHGTGGRRGCARLISAWLFVDLCVGIAAAATVQIPIRELARDALLPMSAIFVGLSFSWAGNALSILQSDEAIALSGRHPGGLYDYVFPFQLCILVLLLVAGLWLMALIQPAPVVTFMGALPYGAHVSLVLLFASASLAIRISWQAISGANLLLLARVKIRLGASNGAE